VKVGKSVRLRAFLGTLVCSRWTAACPVGGAGIVTANLPDALGLNVWTDVD
jgi:hypothetical protein